MRCIASPGRTDAGGVLRGALVGFGNVALHAHLPVWRAAPGFAVEAVVEPDPGRAALAREHLPGARLFETIESLLAAGGLDFVDICTPPQTHARAVIAALGAGLHVLCEKPLATTQEDFALIREAAETSGLCVMTVHNWKYAPIWEKALALVRGGVLGAVREVTLTVLRPPSSGGGATDWRTSREIAGGGILVDHGWHNLYLALALVGEAPLGVAARLGFPGGAPDALEDEADVTLRFSSARARLHLTWRADRRANLAVVTGERGTLYLRDDHIVVEVNGAPERCLRFGAPLSGGSHHADWMGPCIEGFRRAVLGEEPGGGNLDEAELCGRLIQCAYDSGARGCVEVAGSAGPPRSGGVPR